MSYKIAPIIIEPERSNALSLIYFSQPTPEEDALAGRLFVLAEINSRRAEDERLLAFITEEANNFYYQNEKLPLIGRVQVVTVETIFETTMTRLNKSLADFLTIEKIKINLATTNIIVGVVAGNKVHFANLGKNKALLIYRPKSRQANQATDYEMIDVLARTNDQGADILNPNKVFTNLVSGVIPATGYFIFTNEALFEYLSAKQLIEIVTTLPPASAAAQIQNILTNLNNNVLFLGAIIKNLTVAEQTQYEQKSLNHSPLNLESRKEAVSATMMNSRPGAIHDSIRRLNQTEEKTEKLLNPSYFVNWRKLFSRLGLANKPVLHSLGNKEFWSGPRTKNIIQTIWRFVANQLWPFLRLLIALLLSVLIGIYRLFSNKEKITAIGRNLRGGFWATINFFLNLRVRQRNMSLRNKILTGLAALCLLVLIGNLIYTGQKKKIAAQQAAYQYSLQIIQQSYASAEASLIYNNQAAAKQALAQMRQALEALAQKTVAQKTTYQDWQSKYLAKYNELNHVLAPTPEKLTQLPSPAQNLVLAGADLYAADNGARKLYAINLRSQNAQTITDSQGLIVSLLSPTVDDNGNVYYLNSDSVLKYNPEGKSLIKMSVEDLPVAMLLMQSYNNKIYILDNASQQIYRYNITTKGLTGKRTWLKEPLDLAGIKALGIDGSMFILKNNQILQYTNGLSKPFALEALDPPLTQAVKLIVSVDSNALYILEAKAQRILVYDKTGKYLSQYSLPALKNIGDFAVDEGGKKIYLLDNDVVYSVGMGEAKK